MCNVDVVAVADAESVVLVAVAANHMVVSNCLGIHVDDIQHSNSHYNMVEHNACCARSEAANRCLGDEVVASLVTSL